LEAKLLHKVYQDNGARPAALPINFLIDWRDGFWVAANFTDSPQHVPAQPEVPFLVGSEVINPGGVAVWQ
jgi:beta-galactosidase